MEHSTQEIRFFLLIFLLSLPLLYGFIEYYLHRQRLGRIPIRIHVNGTRGKSSLTRLIAAGLRAGGIKTLAKTTGSSPRIIYEDGSEEPIFRFSIANIREQMRVLTLASRRGAEAVVLECMAVQPELQWICEHRIIKSTLGVITNVRADHIETMGPTLDDVARALAGTIPVKGDLFTAETAYLSTLKDIARQRDTEVFTPSEKDLEALSDQVMEGFSYLEHKENVALALKVCEHLGVKTEVALKGMYEVVPDLGALRVIRARNDGKTVHFVSAFAANDRESNLTIWRMVLGRYPGLPKLLILNTRADRLQRSEELGRMIAEEVEAQWYVLTGSGTEILERTALKRGVDAGKILNLKETGREELMEKVFQLAGSESVVVGMGNIAGVGREMALYFKNLGR